MNATQKPGSIQWGVGIDQTGKPTGSAMYARTLLYAVTGDLDALGGSMVIVVSSQGEFFCAFC